MSGQPPGSGGASFLPFMTSITTDIYERIDKIAQSFESVKGMITALLENLTEELGKLSGGINEVIEQGEMSKELTLTAFADTTNNIIKELRAIRGEQVAGMQSAETRAVIEAANKTATALETRMYDVQIAILINGIHALINAIKTGKVVGFPVPVPVAGAPASGAKQAPKPELAAPVPSLPPSQAASKPKDKSFFGKGARKKTHDEIMEEKRKKQALFGKYR